VYSQTAANDNRTYKYYYDVYNILGDPSIKPWVGTPKQTFVDYNPVFALNAGHYSVSVMNESGAMENAVVTLVQNENIVAYGVTGIDGTVTLPLDFETLQSGDLILTITGKQQIPFIDTLKVVDPLNVTLEPTTVPVDTISNISVTVLDDSSNAVEGAEIYVSGWTVAGDSLLGTSNSNGVLQFQFMPKYGELLKIKGKLSGEDNYIFAETLQVSDASSFSNPEIAVSVKQFNVENSLVPGHIGQIHGSADESNITLAALGCGIDTLIANGSIQVLPVTIGTVVAALLKPGYEVFEKTVTVSKAYGSLAGLITNTDQQPLADVMITGYLYPDTLNPVFSGVSNTDGEFIYSPSVEVGYYRIWAQLFGHQPQTVVDTVKVGSNVFTIEYLLREPDYSKGDMNKDGQINVLDLTKVVNLILQIDPPGNEFEYWAADLNNDDQINVLDLVWIINIILGREGFAKPVESDGNTLQLSLQDQQLLFESNSPLSALQIEFESDGVFELTSEIVENDRISVKQQNNIILIYSLSDLAIISGTGSLGKLSNPGKIVNALAVDRFGKQVQTALKIIPGQYRLYQNYPNPFNSETVIRFELPKASQVTLELFDLLGRKVATLLDDNRVPGIYDLSWNSRDVNGRELASGIYFYAIHAGDFYQLRKLALVK
ncbi:MAG: dockerin type I domain-containing protein, partial [Candidatus Marinimicrobia bacterium]|nr:dockerin type I domain-containing protein [Candidatus Neomarinimicrobiota bacterium]